MADTGKKVEKKKAKRIEIVMPFVGFPIRMHFNRFAIIHVDNLHVIQFALVHSGLRLDTFTCSLSDEDMERDRERIVSYLGAVGISVGDVRPYSLEPSPGGVHPVRIIQAARSNKLAELSLFAFSLQGALELGKQDGASPLQGEGVARLSSDIETQIAFLLSLFGGKGSDEGGAE